MTKISQAGRDRSPGFTLVELLVVLAIIALISTLAMPTLSGAFGQGLRADAEALGAVMRDARSAAIRENRETVVTIDPERRRVRGANGSVAMELDDLSVSMIVAQRERTDAGAQVRFFPDGRSTGARVTLSREDRTETLSVDWFDGSVSHEPAG